MPIEPLKGVGVRRVLDPVIQQSASADTQDLRQSSHRSGASDQWLPQSPQDSLDAPFWIIQMHRDQTTKRQWLHPRERITARDLESSWVTQWVSDINEPGDKLAAPSVLRDWQTLFDIWQDQATIALPRPRVVFQKAIAPLRAQFLFRPEQHLIQLNPTAPGTHNDRLASVGHELFHHAQQCLVNALYQGHELFEPWLQLARYYRDARIRYIPWHTSRNEHTHHQQDLEKGAVQFAQSLRRHLGQLAR